MNINKVEIARLTEEYGGKWGINHTQRLLHLISIIGEGFSYNGEAVWLAAYLHDWGGYSPWLKEGVDHALRSKQVAEDYLANKGLAQDMMALILESIEFHHQGNPSRSLEANLLSDADAIDFLGVVGVLRDFSRMPKDMRKAYETARKHREKLPGMLCLDKSREMAVIRIQQMDELFAAFEQDAFGYF